MHIVTIAATRPVSYDYASGTMVFRKIPAIKAMRLAVRLMSPDYNFDLKNAKRVIDELANEEGFTAPASYDFVFDTAEQADIVVELFAQVGIISTVRHPAGSIMDLTSFDPR